MPSGISHILLSDYLTDRVNSENLRKTLSAGGSYFLVGSVGPDLPYASKLDKDYILSSQSELADDFHYRKTNQIPLRAFTWIKQFLTSNINNTDNLKLLDDHFCFFLGFCSHIIADGIMHPFVRDKVGEYKDNSTEHRALEMCLDVLLYKHLTEKSGEFTELNYSNIHDRLKELDSDKNRMLVMELFSTCICDEYKKEVSPETVAGWPIGLYRLFDVAEGKHPKIYREPDWSSAYFFKNASDLNGHLDKYLSLEKPEHWQNNFLNKNRINFLDDCVPQFFAKMKAFSQRAYNATYENGPPLSESDLPAINLDNGRLLSVQNENSTTDGINKQTPYFWA